jgi:hypothetical protein
VCDRRKDWLVAVASFQGTAVRAHIRLSYLHRADRCRRFSPGVQAITDAEYDRAHLTLLTLELLLIIHLP